MNTYTLWHRTPLPRGLREPLVRLRHRVARPGDRWLASYPRSGSTWLRFMVYHALAGSPGGFHEVDRDLPEPGVDAAPRLRASDGGRIWKTHEPHRTRYRHAVALLRDPRDVVLSEHRYQLRLGVFHGELDAFARLFVQGRTNGYGSWGRHTRSWLDAAARPELRVRVVRFRDLRSDPAGTLITVLRHLELEPRVDPTEVVARHGVSDMKRAEEAADHLPADRDEVPFIGEGRSGGWRDRLPERWESEIRRAFGAEIEALDAHG